MKTGTLTFHAPNNNGSFLQAYALQHVLINKFHIENEIINYYSQQQERQYSLYRIPHSAGDMGRNLISASHRKEIALKNRRFDEMRGQYLHMTPRYKTEEEVRRHLDEYDSLICGSDQIWNTKARDFSEIYLLDNVSKNKVAYAVSCGSRLEDIDKEKVFHSAKEFRGLSVRETALYSFFKEKGLDVEKVLDPTLLLEKEQYGCLYDSKPYVNGNYILLYTINFDDEILKTVQKLADSKGLQVYTPFTGYSAIKCRKYGIKVLYDVGPAQFLNLIENATYTCSNSFHGIVFSIVFGKCFYRLCSTNENKENIVDDRIDGLLDALELTSVNINQYNVLDRRLEWDYSIAKERLNSMREQSIAYLRKTVLMD